MIEVVILLFELKRILFWFLKNDYAIKIYNKSDYILTLNFYKLDDVYNGFCYVDVKCCGCRIDWQYRNANKLLAAKLNKLSEILKKMNFNNEYRFEEIKKEFEFFNKKATEVFLAKYSTETWQHFF